MFRKKLIIWYVWLVLDIMMFYYYVIDFCQVFYNESVAEYAELVELFGFNAIAVSNVTSMNGRYIFVAD